jgi:tetratricopeptide (TPR) repeat protein
MTEETDEEQQDLYRKLASETFNATWGYLDKAVRTAEENDAMVHAAHTSRYFWQQVGTPLEFERGDWQLSRVYSSLGKGVEALHYARHCLDICLNNEIGDFDLAFAYEAMSRAHAVLENYDKSEAYGEQAMKAGEAIAEQDNRDYFMGELATVPKKLD